MGLGQYLGAGSGVTKGLYRLENVNDSSGNGNTLTNTGSVAFVAGRFGNCADFGTTDNHTAKVLTRTSFGVDLSLSGMCMSTWIKVRAAPGGTLRRFFNWFSTTGTARYFSSQYELSGSLRLRLDASGTVATYNADLGTTAWHHYLVTCTAGGAFAAYLDGTSIMSGTRGSTTTVDNTISLGNNTGLSGGLACYMDEAFFENVAWTAAQVQKHYTYARGRFGV